LIVKRQRYADGSLAQQIAGRDRARASADCVARTVALGQMASYSFRPEQAPLAKPLGVEVSAPVIFSSRNLALAAGGALADATGAFSWAAAAPRHTADANHRVAASEAKTAITAIVDFGILIFLGLIEMF